MARQDQIGSHKTSVYTEMELAERIVESVSDFIEHDDLISFYEYDEMIALIKEMIEQAQCDGCKFGGVKK